MVLPADNQIDFVAISTLLIGLGVLLLAWLDDEPFDVDNPPSNDFD
jgi:hypothetical protein